MITLRCPLKSYIFDANDFFTYILKSQISEDNGHSNVTFLKPMVQFRCSFKTLKNLLLIVGVFVYFTNENYKNPQL